MIKGKKAGKCFEEIGKRWYEFDFELEKGIYCYLCCYRIKRKELRNLNDDLMFETYQKWKQYVYNKYSNYSREQLMEFSRYLNYEIRNERPFRKYWDIMLPITISLVFTKIFDIGLALYVESVENPSMLNILLLLCLEVIGVIFLINIFRPLFDDNIKENLFIDYKEIVDEIIEEKTVN